MNVYQKLAVARLKLKQMGLKPSGKNKGLNYTYFDLPDILPQTTQIEHELNLLSVVSFSETEGTLTVYDTEKPTDTIIFRSPLKEAKVGNCQPVQNLGAMETYVRRYLYLLAYEIAETDALDKDKSGADEITKDNTSSSDKSATGKKTKYQTIKELVKDSEFCLEDVTEYITNKFGEGVKINDLSEEQFTHVINVIKKNISNKEDKG